MLNELVEELRESEEDNKLVFDIDTNGPKNNLFLYKTKKDLRVPKY